MVVHIAEDTEKEPKLSWARADLQADRVGGRQGLCLGNSTGVGVGGAVLAVARLSWSSKRDT